MLLFLIFSLKPALLICSCAPLPASPPCLIMALKTLRESVTWPQPMAGVLPAAGLRLQWVT